MAPKAAPEVVGYALVVCGDQKALAGQI